VDAITLLKDQHHDVEKLFKQYEEAGERAHARKRDLVDKIIEALSKHAAIEEQLFYPVTRETVPAVEDEVLESLEEHHIVKWTLSELETLDATDERFDAKVTVLIEHVRHHVKEEETEYFPKVRDELGRNALGDLGDAMEQALTTAQTHPHPRAAQTPPRNLIEGAVIGVTDRVVDTVNGVVQGSYGVVADVVAGARGETRTTHLSGGPTTRRAARRTKRTIDTAREEVVDQVKRAKATGEDATDRARRTAATTARTAKTGAVETGRAATAAAKGTVTSAERAAKATTTTAKRGATTTRRTARTSARTAKKAAAQTGRAATAAAKGTVTSAERGAKETSATAKRGATTTRRTARKSTKRVSSQAKRQANTSKTGARRSGKSSSKAS